MSAFEFSGQGATGAELAYTEYTSSVNLSATTEATANTIVTAASITLDGSTSIIVEFYCSALASPGGGTSRFSIIDLYWSFNGGAAGPQGFLADTFTNLNGQIVAACLARRKLTPAAGDYVFSARGHVTAGTGVANAGTGGSGQFMPGYIRVTRA